MCSPLCPAHPEGDPGPWCSVPSLKIESRDPATPQGRSRPCKETDPLGADGDRERHRALLTALVAGGSPSGHMQGRSSQRLLVKASRCVREPLLGLSTPGRTPEPTGRGQRGTCLLIPLGAVLYPGSLTSGGRGRNGKSRGQFLRVTGCASHPGGVRDIWSGGGQCLVFKRNVKATLVGEVRTRDGSLRLVLWWALLPLCVPGRGWGWAGPGALGCAGSAVEVGGPQGSPGPDL